MISVVVPVYKVEPFLNDCVTSIVKQSFKDLEIILVDDGSPDKCGYMCDQWTKKDSRIKVIHKKNGGLSDARNAGINAAKGKYITFVDSDDFIFPTMLEKMFSMAKRYSADMVTSQYVRCDENTKLSSFVFQSNVEFQNKIITGQKNKMLQYLTHSDIGTVAWGKLYKTVLFKNIKYPYGKYHEDTFTTYKLVDISKKIVTLAQPLYVYRKNHKSISNEPFSYKRYDAVKGKLQQCEYVKAKYPSLVKYANAALIYACNQNLILISKSNTRYSDVREKLQYLYRKYGKDYLMSKVSLRGKIIVVLSIIKVDLGIKILSFLDD